MGGGRRGRHPRTKRQRSNMGAFKVFVDQIPVGYIWRASSMKSNYVLFPTKKMCNDALKAWKWMIAPSKIQKNHDETSG